MIRSFPRSTLAALLVVWGAALWPSPAAAQWRAPSNCSAVSQNTFVRDVMRDIYYWYREMPVLNPARYASPEAYLEAVRYKTLDSRFSYIGLREAEDAFYSESQYIGFGFGSAYVNDQLRVSQVFPDSPAAEIGLTRGDRFVEINGVTIEELAARGQLGGVFGASREGVTVEVVYERADGERVGGTMVKRVITIPTVTDTQVYTLEDGRRVGYLFFRNFVQPSVEALDAAFAVLKDAQVHDLVLDLRYNGGGLVSVAQHLSSMIGGPRTNGQLLAEYFHNDRNAFRNREIRFEEKGNALTLDRVFVITTGSSASASELVINALRPFMEVITIGATSYGKPVGQYGINFCDKVLYPVAFTLRNANGEGDYFEGFAPTCPAADDLDHQLGDRHEGSLAEALRFVTTGECTPAPPEESEPARRTRYVLPRKTGFDALVNAH